MWNVKKLLQQNDPRSQAESLALSSTHWVCEHGLPNTPDLHGVSVPFCIQNFSTQQSLMADYHPPSLLLSFITGFIMKTLTQP